MGSSGGSNEIKMSHTEGRSWAQTHGIKDRRRSLC